MLPVEIYISILVACSCIVLLTVSFIVAAVYFRVRIIAMEDLVTRLEDELAGLIHDSQDFMDTMQKVAKRGNGVMKDVDRMTHTARTWSDRANRLAHALMAATQPSTQFVSKVFRSGGAALSGVRHGSRIPDKNNSFTRSTDMSENSSGSKAPQVMMAFGVGTLIGVGVAMLFSPRSGKETREMVTNKTNGLKDTAHDVIERGKHIVDEVKHEAHEAYEKSKKDAGGAKAA